jgi:DNA adenine methylase
VARSSTTYAAKWRSGKTKVIRVPEILADDVLRAAREMDATLEDRVREGQPDYSLEPDLPAAGPDLSKPVNVASVPQRSPFRYPGGKTWLVPRLRAWLKSLPRPPEIFIEPFAGGGVASLTVAFERLAGHVILAETDEGVSAVWRTILAGQGPWLARTILDFDLKLPNVRKALADDGDGHKVSLRRRAFLTLLRNRVQRGGIMAAGAGLIKTGENNRGIRSRWYPKTLARRIRDIGMNLDRMSFFVGDGFSLIEDYSTEKNAVFYIDPPYTKAARRLYRHWQIDHHRLFRVMTACSGDFLMSYDNTEEIRDMAQEFGLECRPIRMKNTHHAEMTELLIGRNLDWLDRDAPARLQASTRVTARKPRGSSACRR